MSSSRLLLAETPTATFVSVEGKGLRNQSEALRRLLPPTSDADEPHRLVIVLDRCEYLDSTFLGNLVQLAKRRRGAPQLELDILADEETADRLFGPCNLQHYLPIRDPADIEQPTRWQPVDAAAGSEDCAYHQLEAHESLAELDIPEAPAFRRIADALRRELRGRDT